MSFTNGYIENTGCKILKTFIGCFPSDLQPLTKKSKFSIIFNLSKHNEKGSHFVAIYKDKDKLIYFDSFGEPASNKLLLKFIRKHQKDRKYSYNKNKIQDDTSSFCGIFCLSFLASQENNVNLVKYLKHFNKTNLCLNDQISTNVLKSFI